ncbi:bifunctional diguanylate cyclase/phosphodiesterase [Sphingosinicella terrae]|uniref:bifunctional diguanylate cyclase/phosphodiesterase n=1 Tax=Sphingosinicella terrae TaxID=2172047 RepID=UPI000E0DB245|nr:EAL domain-containing protein [Sphingosinicella terrae]
MLRVYTCITQEHDLSLVVVAGIICLLAALSAFATLERGRAGGEHRWAWIAATAFVSGIGIWATHFLAMLAYQPDLPIRYDLARTILSIAAAILITGAGWALVCLERRAFVLLGGLVVGAGIATMHYIGMSAVDVGGFIRWDSTLVAASVLIGLVLSPVAIAADRRQAGRFPWTAALLFTLAICGLHFTGMAAAVLYPAAGTTLPDAAIGSETLKVIVIAVALVILFITFATILFDRKLARRDKEEAVRIRAFADAAVEGLVIVDGVEVIDANRSFLRLAGFDDRAALPGHLPALLPEFDAPDPSRTSEGKARESQLVSADGSTREIEVLVRPLSWKGRELQVLAVRDISERKEAEARIAHLAFHDVLTGLPNRAVFLEKLAGTTAGAASDSDPVAILCLDLDGFKAINDLLGHSAGDELLVGVAWRLRTAVGEDGLVARLGGDEFAVLQRGGPQPAAAGLLAERIITALEAPFDIGGRPARISASIGIALFPADADAPGSLIKNADLALYRAKAEGRGLTRFYEAAMDEALRQRRQLESDLRSAIEQGELHVHYQPLADLASGSIVGFEALLRWNHPQLGPISPEVFVRLAEEGGMIDRLGEWVLRQACSEAAGWNPPLKLSVNLSPLQFLFDDLVGSIERVLAETGLDPARLDLEVTEGLLIKDAAAALAILQRLKALGVQISMDDFGTGYSSLSYFRMFPFDKVKIDRSFVQEMTANPQARAIIRSVIGLGRGLGMPVVAEGVETPEQLEALRAEGCDQVQGYLISRPNPIGYFEGVVLKRPGEETQRRRA